MEEAYGRRANAIRIAPDKEDSYYLGIKMIQNSRLDENLAT